MNFNDAYQLLKSGKKLRRADWNYFDFAYIELYIYKDKPNVYIYGCVSHRPDHYELYKFSCDDVDSTAWELVS